MQAVFLLPVPRFLGFVWIIAAHLSCLGLVPKPIESGAWPDLIHYLLSNY
jgi:hypothetical protein